MKKIIRLGTRGSPLALIQAENVRRLILESQPKTGNEVDIQIVPIRTTGDWKPENKERSFIELGGNKGLFTKEIEEALLGGHIDMAVHSMKDVASWLPGGLDIAVILHRIDARDAFIGREAKTLDDLPQGATIGTSSLRRQAQLLARRPDLRIVPLRGNVDTRLKKLADGIADATLLAVAGLMRLDMTNCISSIMDTETMLPAAAQGAIGIEIRRGDKMVHDLLQPLNAPDTFMCVSAERAALKILDGSCHTPIAALAKIKNGQMTLEALVAKADGTSLLRLEKTGPAEQYEEIGSDLGRAMKEQLPLDFFAS